MDNPDLISLLKLPEKSDKSDGKHYSWKQLEPMFDTLGKENNRVQKVESANRTAYENAISKLERSISLYARLRNTVQPADTTDWLAQLAEFEKLIPAGIAAVQAQQTGQKFDQANFNRFVSYISTSNSWPVLSRRSSCRRAAPDPNGGVWATYCWRRHAARALTTPSGDTPP